MDRYLIGIDTGGTFTDGVLLNYANREVVSAAKSLTTRQDLKQGVIKVLKKLTIPEDCSIKLVGISSTLATNSIVEGKARKVALLLIGYQSALVENFGLESEFATEDLTYIQGGHNAQGGELAPLDEKAIRDWIREKKDEVDAIAVSSYFSPLNPAHEKQALDIIAEESSLPVVMGHQLSTKLNSVKRAATASVNASLVSVMQDFLHSVSNSLKELKIEAPLMIVRGDGTLMPYEEALQKPVETVMSGPAASAIGGKFLSNINKSLVIDMGSTTTDLALVENSRVVVSEAGAKVGNINTAVEAAQIRTISLGCDSRISFNSKNEPVLGPDRVRSLSQISMHYPEIKNTLYELSKDNCSKLKSPYDVEFWHQYQELGANTEQLLSEQQKAVIEKLKKPKQLSELMDEFQVVHPEHLKMHELIHQGYIECSTLNSTDLLHATSAMELWDSESANNATLCISRLHNLKKKELVEKVFDIMQDRLVEEILLYMANRETKKHNMPGRIDGEWGKWLLNEILYHNSDLLTLELTSKIPVIGTGAPAKHFMKEVTRLINTRLYLPYFSEVANAIGAVSGSITETREAIVFVKEEREKYNYQMKYGHTIKNFDSYTEACEMAEQKAYQLAKEATQKAGGTDPHTEVIKQIEGSLTRFTARSAGSPKLSKYNEENIA